jgi:hypothetical protein
MQLVKLLEALKQPHNLGQFPEFIPQLKKVLEIAKRLPVDSTGAFVWPEAMTNLDRVNIHTAAEFKKLSVSLKKALSSKAEGSNEILASLLSNLDAISKKGDTTKERFAIPTELLTQKTKLQPLTRALEKQLFVLGEALALAIDYDVACMFEREEKTPPKTLSTREKEGIKKYVLTARRVRRQTNNITTPRTDIGGWRISPDAETLNEWKETKDLEPSLSPAKTTLRRSYTTTSKINTLDPAAWAKDSPLHKATEQNENEYANIALLTLALASIQRAHAKIRHLNAGFSGPSPDISR